MSSAAARQRHVQVACGVESHLCLRRDREDPVAAGGLRVELPETACPCISVYPGDCETPRSALRWPHGMGACCNLPCPARVQLASHRNPSTVSRDVSKLSELGLVKVESVSNEGHGQKKTVLPVANTISISAAIAAA